MSAWLLLAHLDHGADTALTTAIYSLGFIALTSLAIVFFGFKRLPLIMLIMPATFLIWLSLGLFGPWPQAQAEVQALAAAAAIVITGNIIGRRFATLSTAWTSLILSLLILSCLAFYAHFAGISAPVHENPTSFDSRLSAGFGSPNTAATLFAMSIILAWSHVFVRVQDLHLNRLTLSNRIQWLAQKELGSFALAVLAIACLILTRSRAGILIGLSFMVLLISIELYRSVRHGRFKFLKRRSIHLSLIFAALLFIVVAILGGLNPQHMTSLDSEVSGRLAIFNYYWGLWHEEPYFGHGLGSFNRLNDEQMTLHTAAGTVRNGAAHNMVLQWLIQQGVVGLLLMGAILGSLLVPVFRALNVRASLPRHFLRATLIITGIVFVHGMGDYAMEIPSVMWTYAFIIGLASGYAKYIIDSAQPKHE